MAQFIDKAAVVAEIERRYEINLIGAHGAFRNGKIEALREMKDFLNALEVKDVDLEKEISAYLKPIKAWQICEAPYTSMENIARHFFELGLNARNNVKKAGPVNAH